MKYVQVSAGRTVVLLIAVGAVIAMNFCNYGCLNYRRSLGESLIIDGPQFSISKSQMENLLAPISKMGMFLEMEVVDGPC